jgi:hypothetical protein
MYPGIRHNDDRVEIFENLLVYMLQTMKNQNLLAGVTSGERQEKIPSFIPFILHS